MPIDPPVIPNAASKPNGTADVIVVGAGPVGLFAAFYAGLRGLSVSVIDSHERVGGQLSAFYPEELIYDVPGFAAVPAAELAGRLYQQAAQLKPVCYLGEAVTALRSLSDGPASSVAWEVATDMRVHQARAIVLAVGAGRLSPKRLTIPSAHQFEDRGLYYRLADPAAFADQRVLVVGGSDEAVSAAITLSSIASHVTLIHRHSVLRASDAQVQTLRQTAVDVRLNHDLLDLRGHPTLDTALLLDRRDSHQSTLSVDAVLAYVGHDTSLRPIQDWGLAIEANGIRVGPTMQTSLPGVYAAGDIAVYPSKIKLIATGFSEAAAAINHATHYLRPHEKVFPGYSTSVAPRRLAQLR